MAEAYTEKYLAGVQDEYGTEWVALYEFRFDWQDYNFSDKRFFVVKHRLMDHESYDWDRFYNDLRSAMAAFGKEANKKYRPGGPKGELVKAYGKVEYSDDWKYVRDELRPYEDDGHYHSSATNGDYGPSNPWDAPGMKISDFLPGVY